MVHIEAVSNRRKDVLLKQDTPTLEAAFRESSRLLIEGYASVKVWAYGDRNMPLELTAENYRRMFEIHVRGRTVT